MMVFMRQEDLKVSVSKRLFELLHGPEVSRTSGLFHEGRHRFLPESLPDFPAFKILSPRKRGAGGGDGDQVEVVWQGFIL